MRRLADAALTEKEVATTNGCILYQDQSKRVTIVDLPTSINCGQLASDKHQFARILSCEPIEQAYATTEPKTALAAQRVQSRIHSLTSAKEHEQLIELGLSSVPNNGQRVWCLPRITQLNLDMRRTPNQKRKADEALSSSLSSEPRLLAKPLTGVPWTTTLQNYPEATLQTVVSLQNQCFINSQPSQSSLHIPDFDATYLIPPKSSFILASLSPSSSSLLSLALLSTAPNKSRSARSGEFDLILLDPPWPNRSARRAAAYKHTSITEDPFCGFAGILPQHLAGNGFVACWITHAQTTRMAVEQLFNSCNIEIVEEWTWAKVTKQGEPIVPLYSQWRRGWEVLIVGQRRSESVLTTSTSSSKCARRLVVAVPDLHSRKPCLKELFEQLLLKRKDARVLEVFARHLVAGWCSVGDEVLRFNWSGHWENSMAVP